MNHKPAFFLNYSTINSVKLKKDREKKNNQTIAMVSVQVGNFLVFKAGTCIVKMKAVNFFHWIFSKKIK